MTWHIFGCPDVLQSTEPLKWVQEMYTVTSNECQQSSRPEIQIEKAATSAGHNLFERTRRTWKAITASIPVPWNSPLIYHRLLCGDISLETIYWETLIPSSAHKNKYTGSNCISQLLLLIILFRQDGTTTNDDDTVFRCNYSPGTSAELLWLLLQYGGTNDKPARRGIAIYQKY